MIYAVARGAASALLNRLPQDKSQVGTVCVLRTYVIDLRVSFIDLNGLCMESLIKVLIFH